jgi:hypothetical protein
VPILPVSIIYNHTKSKRIEAYVDSGASTCLFHANIGRAIGMHDLEAGKEGPLGGVVRGVSRKVYYHPIKLCIGPDIIPIVAGFCDELSVGAILGRSGFFDNYTITFDPCNNPPGFEIQRVHRI